MGDAEQLFRNYNVTNGIPEGIKIAIRVSNDDYLEMIQFAYIEHKKLGKGGSSKQPSVQTKSHLVKLLNYVGLLSTRFERLLNIKSRVEIEPPPPSDQEPCKRNCSVTLLFIKNAWSPSWIRCSSSVDSTDEKVCNNMEPIEIKCILIIKHHPVHWIHTVVSP